MNGNDLPEPSNATVIFVLGLLGLIVCGILGIIAFFMGRGYKQQVAQGLVRKNGLAEAGYIMGLISIILLVIGIIFVVFFGGLAFLAGPQMEPGLILPF